MKGLDFWRKVEETLPSQTKSVPKGGYKLTAIDAYSQIKKMTEHFGPCGSGWWYETIEMYTPDEKAVVIKLSLFTELGDHPIMQYGCVPLHSKNGYFDDEAHKKATTNALTKAFSMLGLNADVFLGKFDDNKYVAELVAAEKAKALQISQKMIDTILDSAAALHGNKVPEYIDGVLKGLGVKSLSEVLQADGIKWADTLHTRLSEKDSGND